MHQESVKTPSAENVHARRRAEAGISQVSLPLWTAQRRCLIFSRSPQQLAAHANGILTEHGPRTSATKSEPCALWLWVLQIQSAVENMS